jgi:hypothetical protein
MTQNRVYPGERECLRCRQGGRDCLGFFYLLPRTLTTAFALCLLPFPYSKSLTALQAANRCWLYWASFATEWIVSKVEPSEVG